MITRRFEYVGGGSNKFWEITYPDSESDAACNYWTCRWGRIGTDGQEKEFFDMNWRWARRAAEKKIDEKLRKGYVAVGAEPIHRPHLRIPMTETLPYVSPRSGRRTARVEPPKPAATQPSALTGGMDISKPKRRKIVLE